MSIISVYLSLSLSLSLSIYIYIYIYYYNLEMQQKLCMCGRTQLNLALPRNYHCYGDWIFVHVQHKLVCKVMLILR